MSQSKKITALIIDDEEHARENLEMLISDFCPEIKVIGKEGSIDSAYQRILQTEPDLIFLDIRMPSGMEGLDLLSKFDNPSFLVIFVTAFKDYAVEAMNVNAIHYILKPIDIHDLENAVNKVIKLKSDMQSNPNIQRDYITSLKEVYEKFASQSLKKISINHSKGIKLIAPSHIVFVEADSNCTIIHMSDGSNFTDTRTLAVYEDLLPVHSFYRIHRSHLINLEYLEEYRRDNGHYVVLKGGQKLPIAKKRLTEFIANLRKLSN